ncbi:MAG: saccharopine dehydrogenase NADP-binding domain-containing protein [Bacteroidetes bacterium]|nr:saccharopine dehydrogenase NADP-binding domain-containing protein [Bacteroidota bacterium]
MKNILIIGAGKSTSQLFDYLYKATQKFDFKIKLGDLNVEAAKAQVLHMPEIEVVSFDCHSPKDRAAHIPEADLVISMLPAHLHIDVARDCITYKKHLVTASYVSDEMKALHAEVKANNLVFMNEIGVDPGIDHMSAMRVIDRIRNKGGKMLLFESFAGGLVAPESDDNLWNYKFSWNPRNVVLAGQGGAAKFIQEGTYKYIPYHQLFRRTEFLEIQGYGRFEAYANRDSLKYRKAYQLEDALTLYRGTIRRVGFSRAWQIFVLLGMTDDSYIMEGTKNMTYREFTNAFLPYHATDSVEIKLRHLLKIDQDDIVWDKLLELDLFDNHKIIGLENASPAKILQKILEEKWTLTSQDKDMLVMYHKFGYEINGQKKQIDAYMVTKGEDKKFTAMSKTVGLPVGIAAVKILTGEISKPGVQIPISPEVYEPILDELEENGIVFTERETDYLGYNPDSIIAV